MLKGILDLLLKTNKSTNPAKEKKISTSEIEALVDAKLKEHTATIQHASKDNSKTKEDYTLTPKQIDYAVSIVAKIKNEYELAISPSNLTLKDLNRLIAYQKFKNKGILINMEKKGVLRKK